MNDLSPFSHRINPDGNLEPPTPPEALPSASTGSSAVSVVPVQAILESLSDGVQAFDREWRYIYLNAAAERLLGRKQEELLGKVCWEEYPEAVGTPFQAYYLRAMAEQVTVVFEDVCPHQNTWIEFALHPSPGGLVAYQRDVTERKRNELLIAGQSRILEQVASGASLSSVLEAIARLIESQAPDVVCSILLRDDREALLRLGAGPSLPPEYARELEQGFPIGPSIGSCGAAAYHKTPVYSEIASDPHWEKARALPLAHGLAACWSHPILGFEGKEGPALGTLGIFYREVRPPTPFEEKLAEVAAHIAQIAIEREHSDRRRRVFIREMLISVSEGKFQLCLSASELPSPLPLLCPPQPLTLENLSRLRGMLMEQLEQIGIPVERRHDLVTAASEAASNAVQHAQGGSAEIRGDMEKGRIQLWIKDRGTGIGETLLHRVALERGFSTSGTLGHGFFMMQRLCDRLYLWTEPQGTTLVLEQRRSPEAPLWLTSRQKRQMPTLSR